MLGCDNEVVAIDVKLDIFLFKARKFGFENELVALIFYIGLAACKCRSAEEVIFKIVKCIKKVVSFLFKRCDAIHKDLSFGFYFSFCLK